jgi:hypothetical protein
MGAEQVIKVVPEEGIFLAMNVLLRSGDHIVATAVLATHMLGASFASCQATLS